MVGEAAKAKNPTHEVQWLRVTEAAGSSAISTRKWCGGYEVHGYKVYICGNGKGRVGYNA